MLSVALTTTSPLRGMRKNAPAATTTSAVTAPTTSPVRERSGGWRSAVASIRLAIGGGGMSGMCEMGVAGRGPGIAIGSVFTCGGKYGGGALL